MRILHVYKTYFPESHGGLEEAIRQMCLATSELGVDNQVFTLGPRQGPRRIERPEATVLRFPRDLEIASCGMSASALAHFRGAARQADLIHYHYPWPFADLMHLASATGTPAIITWHSDIVRQRLLEHVYRPLRERFLNHLSRIVCTSPNYLATSETLSGSHSRSRPPAEVIPIGLDPNSCPEADDTTLADTEARWGRDFFLFVGVLRYYKGLHILLEALRGAPFKVVIAGTGPEERALKEKARQAGLQNLHFTGYVSDACKAALYRLSRAVVFPSHLRSEAFGVTLVEGAMFGKAMITTEIGTGTSYVNAHESSGLVVTPNDPQALRAAMERLYWSPDLTERLGAGARARYERLFSSERMGQAYLNLYRDVLAETAATNHCG